MYLFFMCSRALPTLLWNSSSWILITPHVFQRSLCPTHSARRKWAICNHLLSASLRPPQTETRNAVWNSTAPSFHRQWALLGFCHLGNRRSHCCSVAEASTATPHPADLRLQWIPVGSCGGEIMWLLRTNNCTLIKVLIQSAALNTSNLPSVHYVHLCSPMTYVQANTRNVIYNNMDYCSSNYIHVSFTASEHWQWKWVDRAGEYSTFLKSLRTHCNVKKSFQKHGEGHKQPNSCLLKPQCQFYTQLYFPSKSYINIPVVHSSLQRNQCLIQMGTVITWWWVTPLGTNTSITWSWWV